MLSKDSTNHTAFRARSLPSPEPWHWKHQIDFDFSRVPSRRQGNFPPTLEAAPYTCELMTPLLGSLLTPEQSSKDSKS